MCLQHEAFSAFIFYPGSSNWILFSALFFETLKTSLLNEKRKRRVIYTGRRFFCLFVFKLFSLDQIMCFETMERSKYEKKVMPGTRYRWSPFFDQEKEAEGLRPGRINMGKITTRGCLRQKQKRARLIKIAKTTTETTKETLKTSYERRTSEACGGFSRHPGAMAPPNTTQYLMDVVYQDTKMDVQSAPDPLYAELGSCSESCLYFQQKDFEELFSTNLE